MHWHTVNNMPGYLPTSDEPSYFETWQEARQALYETLLYERDLSTDNAREEYEEAVRAYREIKDLPTDFDQDVTVYAAGRAWQILGCQETECGTEET